MGTCDRVTKRITCVHRVLSGWGRGVGVGVLDPIHLGSQAQSVLCGAQSASSRLQTNGKQALTAGSVVLPGTAFRGAVERVHGEAEDAF